MERTSISELIESLIERVNKERKWLLLLCLVSLTVSPIIFLFSLNMAVHHKVLYKIRKVNLTIWKLTILNMVGSLVVSTIWMIVGIKEVKFIFNWNDRFKEYLKHKEEIDKKISNILEE